MLLLQLYRNGFKTQAPAARFYHSSSCQRLICDVTCSCSSCILTGLTYNVSLCDVTLLPGTCAHTHAHTRDHNERPRRPISLPWTLRARLQRREGFLGFAGGVRGLVPVFVHAAGPDRHRASEVGTGSIPYSRWPRRLPVPSSYPGAAQGGPQQVSLYQDRAAGEEPRKREWGLTRVPAAPHRRRETCAL